MKKIAIFVIFAACWFSAECAEDAWARWYLDLRRGTRDLERRVEEAVKSCRVAAEAGDAEAQFCLGLWYAKGDGVEQSYEEAVKWYWKAAGQGYARAEYNLGWCYSAGRGVEKSEEEAFKWWCKAAQGGHVKAQCNLGWCYEKGRGVEPSDLKALEWYMKAAWQGDEYAKKAIKRLEKERAEGKGQE